MDEGIFIILNIRIFDRNDAYGLGSVRTLKEFEAFCGVDFDVQKLNRRALNGGAADSMFRKNPLEALGLVANFISMNTE